MAAAKGLVEKRILEEEKVTGGKMMMAGWVLHACQFLPTQSEVQVILD